MTEWKTGENSRLTLVVFRRTLSKMLTGFDKAFKRVRELVADFRDNENFFLSSQYSEAQARKDFIDEFFTALGWDVNHQTQRNPYEQEVKIERK